MPKSEIAIISARRASSGEIARQALVKFATICQKEFSPALANIWDEQLRDIEPDLLARACDQLMKKWNTGFLPVPGNIRREAEHIAEMDSWKKLQERTRKQPALLTEGQQTPQRPDISVEECNTATENARRKIFGNLRRKREAA